MSNVRIGEIGAANHVDIESDVRKVSPPTSRTSTIVNDVADPECNSRKRLREHESEKFDPCIDKQILDNATGSACNQENSLASTGDFVAVSGSDMLAIDHTTTKSEWDDVVEKIMSDPEATPYRENVEAFVFGIKKLEAAQTSLQVTYEKVHNSLENILENSLAAVIPIHEMDCNVMSSTEMELLELFQYNHGLRKSLLQSLNSHNQQWETKYRNYVSRIVMSGHIDCPSSAVDSTTEVKCSILPSATDCEQNHGISLQNEDCPDSELDALDWDEMIQLNPSSQEKIEAFLEGCDRWNTACNTLSCSFDEIRQTIEAHHSNILHIVESAYSRINNDMMEVQDKVQCCIISNNRRRLQIEQSLEEIVQRQNNIFSRLMARVVGSVPNPWNRSATD